jgi:hypothetical protein
MRRNYLCHYTGLESLTPSYFRKSWSSPRKNEPFSQEMRLEIPHLSRGLKLSNSKPRFRGSDLHFFVKTYFVCFFQWLPGIELIQISAFFAASNTMIPGVWNCHATPGHRKTSIYVYVVKCQAWPSHVRFRSNTWEQFFYTEPQPHFADLARCC